MASPPKPIDSKVSTQGPQGILLGALGPLAHRLQTILDPLGQLAPVTIASSYSQLRNLAARFPAEVIVLDSELLDEVPFVESVHQFAALAPVILLAPIVKQSLFAALAAAGNLDFVAREGDFAPLVAALVERRIRWSRSPLSALDSSAVWAEDVGEVFRHEINNPLTGILGNAELLLSHRDALSTDDAQRVQVVVDLSVRLRETIRRLSNAWESHTQQSVKPI
jgi:signal transduction histidine kinase